MENELSLLDYWNILWRRRNSIIGIIFVTTVISIVVALLLPKTYQAEAGILPIGGGGKEGSGVSALIAQSGLGGLLGGFGINTSGAPLMVVLKSRTLAENVINKLELKQTLFSDLWDTKKKAWKVPKDEVPSMELAVMKLKRIALAKENKKTMLITITAETRDPRLSEKIVTAYIEELAAFLATNNLTSAKRNRIFISGQLEKNKMRLLETGKELSHFYKNRNVSDRDPRIDIEVDNETPTPQILSSLEKKREEIEKQLNKSRLVENVPQQVYLEYLTGYYKLLGSINALLTQQYEMAKIEEAREDISFQIIDPARVPVKRHRPRRTLIVIGTFAMSSFMAIFLAFFLEYLKHQKGSAVIKEG